ncbi:Peroxisomal biogenesis factor 11 [Penicillium atrosanguineum]|uniref:Peroxisomal biogenesis factor 11 n=1 Tax=Penicillium atrosanguineum TaxID=1132637 RepID=UPI0023A29339|nr:Peroxisomal biogenesis factor 11 [Penicillium atrosanguineum]KAJ5313480.1 Peroxisomal biogenesis factor 11 [Penicillium atrosanguineum]
MTNVELTLPDEKPKQSKWMFGSDEFNLDGYIQFRPIYSEALYTEIYRYHKDQEGQWDFAHDAGTGPGIVAEELAKRFTAVAASDPSTWYLAQAKQRLSSSSNIGTIIFGCHPAEDMSWLPEASVDMITIAEAIHWTEHEKVLKSASETLKPGGTLAIWNYGTLPFFVDSTWPQGILEKIHERWLERIKATAKPDQIIRIKRSVQMSQSRMDVIQFDGDVWKSGVRRIHWNSHHPPMGLSKAFEYNGTFLSPNLDDVVERREDKMLLSHFADANWIRGYMDYLYPDLPSDSLTEDLLAELNKAMRETAEKPQLAWTVSVILASKCIKME